MVFASHLRFLLARTHLFRQTVYHPLDCPVASLDVAQGQNFHRLTLSTDNDQTLLAWLVDVYPVHDVVLSGHLSSPYDK